MITGKQVVNQFGLSENFAIWHVLVFAVLNIHVLLGIFISLYEFFYSLTLSAVRLYTGEY